MLGDSGIRPAAQMRDETGMTSAGFIFIYFIEYPLNYGI